MNKSIFIYITFIVLLSCNNDNNKINDITQISINPSENKSIRLSKFVEDYFYIPLESNDRSFISNIKKVQIYKNTLVLGDLYQNFRLIFFDMKGRYLNTLDKQGGAEDEYVDIQDFQIFKDRVYIYDWESRKINIYNFLNCEFITSNKIDLPRFESFLITENLILLDHSGMNDYKLSIIDSNYIVKIQYLPIKNNYSVSYVPFYEFNSYKDKILYSPEFSSIIYEWSGDELIAKIDFNFEKYWPSKEFLTNKEIYPHEIIEKATSNSQITYFNFISTTNYLSVFYSFKNKFQQIIMHEPINNFIKLDHDSDDIKIGVNNIPIGTYKDYFIYEVPAYSIVENIVNNDQWASLNIDIDKNDNPVLLFVKYKL